jgi:hypothetical protein
MARGFSAPCMISGYELSVELELKVLVSDSNCLQSMEMHDGCIEVTV